MAAFSLGVAVLTFIGCPSKVSITHKPVEVVSYRRFVDPASAPGGDGKRWGKAYDTLDAALAAAASDPGIEELWVAAGHYFPADTAGIASSFTLSPNLRVYGGFLPGQGRLTDRSTLTNPSILDGAIGGGTPAEQVRHVVTAAADTVLDGFVITNGSARSGSWIEQGGGGLVIDGVSMIVRDCRFLDNVATDDGGAILAVDATVQISGCDFSANQAAQGGGVQCMRSDVALQDCRFSANTGSSITSLGGGLACYQANVWIEGCEFIDNQAGEHGGGIWVDSSAVFMAYTTLSGNSARWGGGASIYQSQSDIANCLFVANRAEYSLVGFHGGGAINSNDNGIGDIRVVNCTFVDNTALAASGIGGAILANSTEDGYTNCIFSGNRIDLGSGHHIYSTADSILGMSHCLMEGGFAAPWVYKGIGTSIADLGGNEIVLGPDFVNNADPDGADGEWATADDGLNLQDGSPAVGSGDVGALTPLATTPERAAALATDLVGENRILGGTISMGAYEPIPVAPSGGG